MVSICLAKSWRLLHLSHTALKLIIAAHQLLVLSHIRCACSWLRLCPDLRSLPQIVGESLAPLRVDRALPLVHSCLLLQDWLGLLNPRVPQIIARPLRAYAWVSVSLIDNISDRLSVLLPVVTSKASLASPEERHTGVDPQPGVVGGWYPLRLPRRVLGVVRGVVRCWDLLSSLLIFKGDSDKTLLLRVLQMSLCNWTLSIKSICGRNWCYTWSPWSVAFETADLLADVAHLPWVNLRLPLASSGSHMAVSFLQLGILRSLDRARGTCKETAACLARARCSDGAGGLLACHLFRRLLLVAHRWGLRACPCVSCFSSGACLIGHKRGSRLRLAENTAHPWWVIVLFCLIAPVLDSHLLLSLFIIVHLLIDFCRDCLNLCSFPIASGHCWVFRGGFDCCWSCLFLFEAEVIFLMLVLD